MLVSNAGTTVAASATSMSVFSPKGVLERACVKRVGVRSVLEGVRGSVRGYISTKGCVGGFIISGMLCHTGLYERVYNGI